VRYTCVSNALPLMHVHTGRQVDRMHISTIAMVVCTNHTAQSPEPEPHTAVCCCTACCTPPQESVDLVEEIAMQYITDTVHTAMRAAAARSAAATGAAAARRDELKLEDVLYAVRRDPRKVARIQVRGMSSSSSSSSSVCYRIESVWGCLQGAAVAAAANIVAHLSCTVHLCIYGVHQMSMW
jgi:hypothetical protein